MPTIIKIKKKNHAMIVIDSEPSVLNELSDFFTFYVPGYKFMPAYKNKVWDGKIRLFDIRTHELYAGLYRYVKEFAKYQDQLSKNYIYDKRVTSKLVTEAYERGLEEIDADHILILVNLNASAQDTLIAYNKIKAIRDKAIGGEDFETLAKKNSEEPGVKKSGGKLGYFSVFAMLYNFENVFGSAL